MTKTIDFANDPQWPLPSFDAKDWAEAFVKLTKDQPELVQDPEYMLYWFASALMRGYHENELQNIKNLDKTVFRLDNRMNYFHQNIFKSALQSSVN